MSVCTQFHHLLFGRPVSRLPRGLLFKAWPTFLLLSILLAWAIQFTRLILTIINISETPNSCISSLLCRILKFSFTLIPPKFLLKTFRSNVAKLLATSVVCVQYPTHYVDTGLLYFSPDIKTRRINWVLYEPLTERRETHTGFWWWKPEADRLFQRTRCV
jgi:hypothetical protein